MHTFVIAEAGSTWRFGPEQQHLSNAREAIEIAKRCRADAVKFQWVSDPRLMEQRRNVPEGSYNILAWPEKWIKYLATYCEEFEIEFMCTAFLPCDVEKLNPYVKRWKVASLEAMDGILVRGMFQFGKEVIASIGAADNAVRHDALWLHDCKLLQCTVAYPCQLQHLNLSAIAQYDSMWLSGLSDHSCNVLTGAIAVSCGAEIIEVHFKLDRAAHNNPDYNHSLWPDELAQYISLIRQAEVMLGDGVKKVEKCEEWALKHKVRS